MAKLFEEKLHPGPGTIVVAAVFGALLGVILMPLNDLVGLVVAVVAAVGAPAGLWASAPTVSVSVNELSAGRAHIEIDHLGETHTHDAESMKRILGPDIHPNDFRVVRGWVPTGLSVEITDPADPTPRWVLSLRRPEECRDAIAAAQKRRLT